MILLLALQMMILLLSYVEATAIWSPLRGLHLYKQFILIQTWRIVF